MSSYNRKSNSEKLEIENKKMEQRLMQLKMMINKEKEERLDSGRFIWKSGNPDSLTNNKNNPEILDLSKKPKIRLLKKKDSLDKNLNSPTKVESRIKSIFSEKESSGNFNNMNSELYKNTNRTIKCGQCEDVKAAVNCMECSEYYCAKCFASFHLKGALRKHRSAPISAVNTRVSVSSALFKPPLTSNSNQSIYEETGTESTSVVVQGQGNDELKLEENSVQMNSLVQGEFDEDFSHQYFRNALNAWRNGTEVNDFSRKENQKTEEQATETISRKIDEIQKITDSIQFTSSLSYAEKMLLEKNRNCNLSAVDMKYVLDRLSKVTEQEMDANRKLSETNLEVEMAKLDAVSYSEKVMLLESHLRSAVEEDENQNHLNMDAMLQLWSEAENIINKTNTNKFLLPTFTQELKQNIYTSEPHNQYPSPTFQILQSDVDNDNNNQITDVIKNADFECIQLFENKENIQKNDNNTERSSSRNASRPSSSRVHATFNDKPHFNRKTSARQNLGGRITAVPSEQLIILSQLQSHIQKEPYAHSGNLLHQDGSKQMSDGYSKREKLSHNIYKCAPKWWKPSQTDADEDTDLTLIDDQIPEPFDEKEINEDDVKEEIEILDRLNISSRREKTEYNPEDNETFQFTKSDVDCHDKYSVIADSLDILSDRASWSADKYQIEDSLEFQNSRYSESFLRDMIEDNKDDYDDKHD